MMMMMMNMVEAELRNSLLQQVQELCRMMCYRTIITFTDALLNNASGRKLWSCSSLATFNRANSWFWVFLTGICLSFCYQICIWDGFVTSKWSRYRFWDCDFQNVRVPSGEQGRHCTHYGLVGYVLFSPNRDWVACSPSLPRGMTHHVIQVGLVHKVFCCKVKIQHPKPSQYWGNRWCVHTTSFELFYLNEIPSSAELICFMKDIPSLMDTLH